MAKPDTLAPGNCYFLVRFYDNEMLFPYVQTLRYARYEDEESRRIWLFEEPREESAEPGERTLVAIDDDQLYEVLDFQGAIDALAEVAADHPLNKESPPARPSSVPPEATIDDLPVHLSRFVADPDLIALTITVRYTDNGCSIGRRDDGKFEMSFYPKPRREPGKEEKIRQLFASRGVPAHTDYLSDGGRTRILSFLIPNRQAGVVELCRQLFSEVYDMRRQDSLRYTFLRRSEIN